MSLSQATIGAAWKIQVVDEKTGETFNYLKLNDIEALEKEMNAAACGV